MLERPRQGESSCQVEAQSLDKGLGPRAQCLGAVDAEAATGLQPFKPGALGLRLCLQPVTDCHPHFQPRSPETPNPRPQTLNPKP